MKQLLLGSQVTAPTDQVVGTQQRSPQGGKTLDLERPNLFGSLSDPQQLPRTWLLTQCSTPVEIRAQF